MFPASRFYERKPQRNQVCPFMPHLNAHCGRSSALGPRSCCIRQCIRQEVTNIVVGWHAAVDELLDCAVCVNFARADLELFTVDLCVELGP